MATNLTPQTLRESGELVTTELRFGGVSLGYLLNGQVYETTGNGGVQLASNGPFGLEGYHRDGGAGYRAKAERMLG